ncbi:PEP-CTERM sorting domain-containing protein [Mucisphaera sp.]|uniref:PEP-CTERM sorting domain-containing protein n=1 Tax=Mucisphaera sp. TaxID=2913024 RepID=UPI003D13E92C
MNARIATATLLGAALATTTANAQVIYSFSDSASDWTHISGSSAGGTGTAIFDLDYSDFQRFGEPGDGFNYQLPASPNGGGSTTGILLSANDDQFDPNFPNGPRISAILGTGAPAVGTGTANPDYVFKFDLLHASGADTRFTGGLGGTTNHAGAGINYSENAIDLIDYQVGSPTQAGQGQALIITSDTGSSRDWRPEYGGQSIIPRDADEFDIDGNRIQENRSGLAVVDIFLEGQVDIRTLYPDNPNITAQIEDPENPGTFIDPPALPNAGVQGLRDSAAPADHGNSWYYLNNFPRTGAGSADPGVVGGGAPGAGMTYSGDVVDGAAVPGGFMGINGTPDEAPDGGWNEHAIYYVGGDLTYTIDGVVVLYLEDAATYVTQNGTDQSSSASGVPMVAFLDQFSSLAVSPEGGNFAILDNAVLEVAASAPEWNPKEHYGDIDGDGTTTGADIDLLFAEIATNPTGSTAYNPFDNTSDYHRWLKFDMVRVYESELTGVPVAEGESEQFVLDMVDVTFLIEEVLDTAFGDTNLDGAVDLIDLSNLASNFSSDGGWAGGDFNGDGTVDLIDLSTLATNFGFTAAVPEPASLALLSLGGLAALRRSRN